MPNAAPIFPGTESAKAEFLATFAAALPTHASTVGVLGPETTAVINAAALYQWILATQGLYTDQAQEWTALKNRVSYGPAGSLIVLPSVASPTAAPDLPATGYAIFKWIGLLIQRIKKSPGYTTEIGEALGILNFVEDFDPNEGKPALKLKVVNNDEVRVI